MLTAFYVLVAVCTVFVILSLNVVRAHEKKLAEKEKNAPPENSDLPQAQEEEFFTSPIYKAMDFIAKM